MNCVHCCANSYIPPCSSIDKIIPYLLINMHLLQQSDVVYKLYIHLYVCITGMLLFHRACINYNLVYLVNILYILVLEYPLFQPLSFEYKYAETTTR